MLPAAVKLPPMARPVTALPVMVSDVLTVAKLYIPNTLDAVVPLVFGMVLLVIVLLLATDVPMVPLLPKCSPSKLPLLPEI